MTGERQLTMADFSLEGEVGRGATGVVFKAREQATGQVVAVKKLIPKGPDRERWVRRYHDEVRELESLSLDPHENLVGFLGHREDPAKNEYCMILELVDGPSLTRVLKGGPLPAPGALDLLRQIACGVGHLHRLGFVHRDLKPHNILRNPEGRWKVSDYGFVREWTPPDPLSPCAADELTAGTPEYLAPELLHKRGEPSPRTDVYSLGAVMYETLVGTPPRAVAGGVGKLLPRSPDGLADLVAWMLNADPDRRCPDTARIVRAIDELSSGSRPLFVPEGGGVASASAAPSAPGPSPTVRRTGPQAGPRPGRSPDEVRARKDESRAGSNWIVWGVLVVFAAVTLYVLLS